jgi:hypothetical protein
MEEGECLHGLDAGTCSVCTTRPSGRATQSKLRFTAIAEAVDDLARSGEFRTKQVASHPSVQQAHAIVRDDPAFAQHVGMYLTDALGRLNIEQVSPKGQSNAVWRKRGA